MAHKQPSSREDLIYHLHQYHLDICDVALLPKLLTNAKTDGSDQNYNHEVPTKAHSCVLSFFSPVLKEKLKNMLKSSGELYVVHVDLDVSTIGIKAFVDCLYGKAIDRCLGDAIVSEVLKIASLYEVNSMIRGMLNG